MNKGTYYHDRKHLVIMVDFDDSISNSTYPNVGPLFPHVKEVMNRLSKKGVRFILFSAREHHALIPVIKFIKEEQLPFETINKNINDAPYRTRKLFHDISIDDRSINYIPDWLTIEKKIEHVINGGFHWEI